MRRLRSLLAHWLERLAAAIRPAPERFPVPLPEGGPGPGSGNEHWLSVVRSRAPELLDGGGIRAGSPGAPPDGAHWSERSVPRGTRPTFDEIPIRRDHTTPRWPHEQGRAHPAPRWPSLRAATRTVLKLPATQIAKRRGQPRDLLAPDAARPQRREDAFDPGRSPTAHSRQPAGTPRGPASHAG
ncbi:MAG: hypothetical protein ACRDQ7_01590, partial [Haloechinothrix sp.]